MLRQEVTACSYNARDAARTAFKRQHLRLGVHGHAQPARHGSQRVHKFSGCDVRILRIVNAADYIRLQVGFHAPRCAGIQQLAWHAVLRQQLRFVLAFAQHRSGTVKVQAPLVLVVAVQLVFVNQLGVECMAGPANLQQRCNNGAYGALIAACLKLQQPARQFQAGPRLDVERTFRVCQPAQALPKHARAGERYGVVVGHQAGVAMRAAGGQFLLLQQSYLHALLRKKKSRAHTHGAAAHHQCFNLFVHIWCVRIAQLALAPMPTGTIFKICRMQTK